MNAVTIRLDKLNKIFRTRHRDIHALSDVDLTVGQGEFVSLVGPSGCGKSTILRMLANIVRPTSGRISINGVELSSRSRWPESLIRSLGLVFQAPNLLPWLTVRENIALPLRVFRMRDAGLEARLDDLLGRFGLEDHAGAYPAELSGGMAQKAGVLRALVHDPDILLMDEPFGALDPMTREDLDLEILELWRSSGKTIVFITHDVEEAVLLSTRVVVMGTAPGRILEEIFVGLPRPRVLSQRTDERFLALCAHIAGTIGDVDLSQVK